MRPLKKLLKFLSYNSLKKERTKSLENVKEKYIREKTPNFQELTGKKKTFEEKTLENFSPLEERFYFELEKLFK